MKFPGPGAAAPERLVQETAVAARLSGAERGYLCRAMALIDGCWWKQ
ncbi:hypothetical protein ACFU6R_23730 [Streptomyces sp. NPDC057499]